MTQKGDAAIQSALRTVEVEARGLAQLRAALGNGLGAPFREAVERIRATEGRVIVTGMGKSGHVGRKIAATLASTGTPAYFVHPAEASHGDLGMIRSDDVILALSWSGETAELSDLVEYSRRYRVALVAITSRPDSALGSRADIALVLPRSEEACPNGLAPTTSTTMQLVLGDALAVALLEARGFTPEDFRMFHPGGKLGAKLRRVTDIMHKGDRLPVVSEAAPLEEVIAEMGRKGFGCALVMDEAGLLAGIVTDGDLRRNYRADLMQKPVSALMTRNPRIVPPDLLLGEAVEFQERHKITVLVVAEGRNCLGLVHYLDLLRAGAA
ncbi:MAG: KpsF/GutQ family sugar-phosphate isomerase [Methylobacterium sp.]|nr:KpsF/GutQ family sugar-phosphate isomerase [Methylobacterium sp.]MCA3603727.1 KpsF/GutQ family sugar-phosphate isomerase [Methylobacterium sp.]MCA3615397.1 KpsF/GutQ family sugar-phosphate isomerase [Methylobacterium sp.]MCA4909184.1 KpsF/GutQ family sugar-phosphate isomerase [Methylobacterium sp.]